MPVLNVISKSMQLRKDYSIVKLNEKAEEDACRVEVSEEIDLQFTR